MEITDFLRNLGIHQHAGLRINLALEGYRNYTFGCRVARDQPNVQDLAHELAHAAQFGARYFEYRASYRGFLFKLRRLSWGTQTWYEPKTLGATYRELETFAYQAHLMQAGGIKLDLERFFDEAGRILVDFMPDSHLIPGGPRNKKIEWCLGELQRYYSRRKQATVVRRLIEWLDATAHRVKVDNGNCY